MAITLHWHSSVSGAAISRNTTLLGQGYCLTTVGDVIVDCQWLLTEDIGLQAGADVTEKIRAALLHSDGMTVEFDLLRQGTDYSRAVWKALTEIPLGQVSTYSEVAKKLNSGARAVARACRNNPYPGIIPCHRVVAKAGIGGFMGQSQGSLVELKRRLLVYERKIALSGK
ncbi:MAG: methylated-DNA--[protein]-cysteine S-methyltransferase [Methylomonas sp.]|nr:methylated-DNA--[protein]-cysteine S-methyltransferase [Methylomonas sp.]